MPEQSEEEELQQELIGGLSELYQASVDHVNKRGRKRESTASDNFSNSVFLFALYFSVDQCQSRFFVFLGMISICLQQILSDMIENFCF